MWNFFNVKTRSAHSDHWAPTVITISKHLYVLHKEQQLKKNFGNRSRGILRCVAGSFNISRHFEGTAFLQEVRIC